MKLPFNDGQVGLKNILEIELKPRQQGKATESTFCSCDYCHEIKSVLCHSESKHKKAGHSIHDPSVVLQSN